MPKRKAVRTRGLKEWNVGKRIMLDHFMRANERGVEDAQRIVARQGRRELSRKAHPPHTRTPSFPGEPPAMVTGVMRDRWVMRPVRRIRRWRAVGEVGTNVPQSRIQELGGRTGAGHRTKLPPRPYLAPAVRAKRDDIRQAFRRRYEVVILRTNLHR